jgi:hypothetical protein
LLVTVPDAASGNVTLALNGTAPAWVMSEGDTLDAGSIPEGTMLSLVFDGTYYHLLNGTQDRRRSCPTGMVAISEQVCIEVNERPAVDLYTAFVTCAAESKRVCSWSEFHVACRARIELALQNMLNGWEWTNNACNEDNTVRIVGMTTCETASTRPATTGPAAAFRCCYTR